MEFQYLSAAEVQKLGFRCGLEIHPQLLTRKKFFCRCPCGLYSDHHDAEVLRHMRPTLSELGEYMKLLGKKQGYDRPISEPAPNRPGLALSGFFSYFAKKRIQVLGNSEMSCLKKLAPEMRGERFMRMCERDIPAIVISRG